jgi:hypothetical protein
MQLLKRILDRELWDGQLQRPFSFSSPFGNAPFVVLLMVEDRTITPDEQMEISRHLLEQGCRWAMAFGHDASSWDDSIDYAHICRYPDCRPPEDAHVMTTWHDSDTLDEIAQFFVFLTVFDSFKPVNFLLLCIGEESGRYRDLLEEVERQFA